MSEAMRERTRIADMASSAMPAMRLAKQFKPPQSALGIAAEAQRERTRIADMASSTMPAMRLAKQFKLLASLIPKQIETERLSKRLDGLRRESQRWEAERTAAPVITRDAVFRLNQRVETLTEAVITLTTLNERWSRRLFAVATALVVLTIVIVALTVVLVVR
jgi:hypothetical protein